jgi:pimeloyl-ACP methyl ester carboxylesterase
MYSVRHRFQAAISASILVTIVSAGCSQFNPATPTQLDRGLVMVLPGVEQTAWSMLGLVDGLRDAGVDQAIDVRFWGTRPFGTFPNLCSYELNRKRAKNLAGRLADYVQTHPGRPTTLIGYSGGGGIAVFAAEALPVGVKIDRLVLVAPALSPCYDLGVAREHVREGIVSFCSERDVFMLGWGTQTFGTMDRVKTESAGKCGFRDGLGQPLHQDGLKQVLWQEKWCEYGHAGSHHGYLSRAWVRSVLSSYIKRN